MFFYVVISADYLSSATIAELSDPSVNLSLRTKNLNLSLCVDELLPIRKTVTSLSQSMFKIKKRERESNPISKIEWSYLSG